MTNLMNNPLNMMMSAIQSGGNPMVIAQQLAQTNPQVRQAMQMINGKSPAQLKQMAENMARERGVSLNDVARQLGITLPSDK